MVVQTRRKRKQISYYEADSDEDDGSMGEVDLTMEVAKAKRSGNTEKKAKPPTKAPFEMIPDELLPHILSYLDNVRELYYLSSMKKSLRTAISSELVIRAAVFSGKPYSNILNGLMCEISNKRIRVPSTFRLLRLLNAQSCERGKDCFCYNLETLRSGPLVSDIFRSFGMAICTPCLQALSSTWGTDCPSSLRSDKICTHGWSRVLCYPQVEQATGEAVGPMILYRDIKQIQYSYSDATKREEVLESAITSATARAIGPEDEARLQQFCGAHEEATIQYEEHCEAKKRIQLEKKKQMVAKRAARKQELTGVVFRKLEPHFAGFQHGSLILNRDWHYSSGTYKFHHWPSTVALGRLIEAPSSATEKKIKLAATRAKELYTRLEEYGFLGDTFPYQLRQWLGAHPLPEKALVRYFIECKSSLSILRENSWRSHLMYEALIDGDRATMILLILSPEECRNAFAREVATGAKVRSRQKRYQLAKHLWTTNNSSRWNRGRLDSFSNLRAFGVKFDAVKTEYTNVLRKIIQYKKHPDTKAWIEDTLASGNFSQSLTPRGAIDTLYEGDFGESGSSASFAQWRRHHASKVWEAFVFGNAD